MNIVGLKVEGREHPLGVDCLTPGFGWSYRSQGERSVIQSAYRIRVYKIQEQEEAEVWDSGRQPGRRHTCIAYSGAPLESATRYYWRVKVW
ncbi:hypothetical protein K0U00_42005, partial [Paenibacillus sepulcri]|nr:hypothetical protein [Paenibacillus sepulcri]